MPSADCKGRFCCFRRGDAVAILAGLEQKEAQAAYYSGIVARHNMRRRNVANRHRYGSIAMNLRKITVRLLVVALVAGFSGLLCAVKTVHSSRSAVIRKRRSVRAWFLMPKGLRAFSVEEYAKPGDDFVYTMLAGPGSLICWRLQIKAAAEQRKHWENAFANYARTRRFITSGSHHRGPNKLYTGYGVPNGDCCWLIFEDVGGSGDLHITLVYQVRPGDRKMRKYMAMLAVHLRKLWYCLRGNGFSCDSITRAS